MNVAENSLAKKIGEGFFVFFLSSVCATYFSVLLWKELQNTGERGSGVTVGVLRQGQDEVKRRTRTSLVWSPINPGSALYLRDAIRVGPSSSATIELKDKTQIELGPDSLVQLNNLEDFTAGFLKGTFIVRTEKEDTKIQIQNNGKRKVERLSLRLLTPTHREYFYFEKGHRVPINFSWRIRQTGEASSSYLEISESPSFKNIEKIEIEEVKVGSLSHFFDRPGHYYWRVTQNEKPVTEARSFRLIELENPKLLPGEGKALYWTRLTTPPDQLLIEIGQKTYPAATDQTSFSLEGIAPGNHEVKLIAKYGNRQLASEKVQWRIPFPPPLELSLLSPPAQAKLEPSKIVHFVWKTNSKSPVTLEIEKDEKAYFRKTFNAQSFLWKSEELGHFRWRLTTLHEGKEKQSDWSPFERVKPEEQILEVAPPEPPAAIPKEVPKPVPKVAKPKPVQSEIEMPKPERSRLKAPRDLSVEIE